MKNAILTLLSVIAILFATASQVNAQEGDKDISFSPAKNPMAYVTFINQYGEAYKSASIAGDDTAVSITDEAAKASLKASKANSKALRNFAMMYKKDASGASWSIGSEIMTATFSKDNVKTNVMFNKNGKWLRTLTYYLENKTPEDIASIMDYAYPKDDIKQTIKVEEGRTTFYIVQLEGKTTLKKVSVYNGEVNTVQELIKSN